MKIEIISFAPYTQKTLRGFLTIRLIETGLEIRDIALHQKNGNRWLQHTGQTLQKVRQGVKS